MLHIPLMQNNITAEDTRALCDFLTTSDRFTNGPKVRGFEEAWSAWLGVKHSVFVNSGASANLATMLACKLLYGAREVILPAMTWSSDIASVYHCGMEPEFVDIDLSTLAMDGKQALALAGEGKVIFLSHILGLCGLSQSFLERIERSGAILIEDVCESHGATLSGKKLGTFGKASNFSFYYAHHMSTIEGGMICTDDGELYQALRMLRSHGMVREATSETLKERFYTEYPDLNRDFIFAYPGFNMRSTELNAILGLSQLPRLDENNMRRRENYAAFLNGLDSRRYYTDFKTEGNSNYAFTLMLREADAAHMERLKAALTAQDVEFRQGMSGGGNILRQPFVREREGDIYKSFPNADMAHFYGMYIGNYPGLEREKIEGLCEVINNPEAYLMKL
jgi:CDP-6-deoxy-D-xylo-4-hexulose-3-dehydrase